jgi:hypothetical protein
MKKGQELMEIFTTPIVFHPGGWEDTLPAWLRTRVISERLALIENGGWDKATDAEVTCYLYTAALSQPLSSDWTDITLYQAAKQIPQLYEALPNAPRELSDYQTSELNDLKRKIRESQIRKRKQNMKEVAMATKKKLIISVDEREEDTLVGLGKVEGTKVFDFKDFHVPGKMEDVFPQLAMLYADAETKWALSAQNPAYVAPPEPKKVKETAQKPAATKTAADLPLLDKTAKAPAKAEAAIASAIEKVEAKEPAATPAPAVVESGTEAAESGTEAPVSEPAAPAPEATAPAAPVAPELAPAPAAPPAPAVPSGQRQYKLKDGRGPFNTVQDAMDAMGMDKKTRPQHNRWDRLSQELKNQILPVVKES